MRMVVTIVILGLKKLAKNMKITSLFLVESFSRKHSLFYLLPLTINYFSFKLHLASLTQGLQQIKNRNIFAIEKNAKKRERMADH